MEAGKTADSVVVVTAAEPSRGRCYARVVDICHLYEQGLTLRQVAKLTGLKHPYAVQRILMRAGIPRRPRCNPVWVARWPRTRAICSFCGEAFSKRRYYALLGNGWHAKPNQPRFDIHPTCRTDAVRLYGRWWAWMMPDRPGEIQAVIDALPRPGDPDFPHRKQSPQANAADLISRGRKKTRNPSR